MDIPIELFLSFIGFSIAMSVIGIWKRIPLLMFIAGALITFWAIQTDNIVFGSTLTETDKTILPSQVDYMNVNTGTGLTSLRSGSNIFIGEDIVNMNSLLHNKRIDQVCISMSRTGSPTGISNIAIYDSTLTPTSTNYKYLFGTKDVTTFTTTQTTHCFIGVDNYITSPNEAIGVFFSGGSAGNEVNIYTDTSGSVFDGTNSVRTQYVSSWTDTTTRDIMAIISITTIEEIVTNTNEDNLFEFNEYPKILFGIIGALIMLGGAIIWKTVEN